MWGDSKSSSICRLKTKTPPPHPAKWGGVSPLTFTRWCLSNFSWKKEKNCCTPTFQRQLHKGVSMVMFVTFDPVKNLHCTFDHPLACFTSEMQKEKTNSKPTFCFYSLILISRRSRCGLCFRHRAKSLTLPYVYSPFHVIQYNASRIARKKILKETLIFRS